MKELALNELMIVIGGGKAEGSVTDGDRKAEGSMS